MTVAKSQVALIGFISSLAVAFVVVILQPSRIERTSLIEALNTQLESSGQMPFPIQARAEHMLAKHEKKLIPATHEKKSELLVERAFGEASAALRDLKASRQSQPLRLTDAARTGTSPQKLDLRRAHERLHVASSGDVPRAWEQPRRGAHATSHHTAVDTELSGSKPVGAVVPSVQAMPLAPPHRQKPIEAKAPLPPAAEVVQLARSHKAPTVELYRELRYLKEPGVAQPNGMWGVVGASPCAPDANGTVCGGAAHGMCDPYTRSCRCLPGYTGDNCQVSCPMSNGGLACSGHGICALDMTTASTCRCFCGQGVRWFGPHCEQAAPLDNLVWCQPLKPHPQAMPDQYGGLTAGAAAAYGAPPMFPQAPMFPTMGTEQFPPESSNATVYPPPNVYAGLQPQYAAQPQFTGYPHYSGAAQYPQPQYGQYGAAPQFASQPLRAQMRFQLPITEGGTSGENYPPQYPAYALQRVWVGPNNNYPPPMYGTISPISSDYGAAANPAS